MLELFEVTTLAAATFFNVLLGLVVLVKNQSSATNRLFCGLAGVFAAFALVNYISLHPILLSQLEWIRIDISVGVLMFMLTYLTFATFPGRKLSGNKTLRRLVVYGGFPLIAICLSPLVFSRLDVAGGSPQPIPGPGMPIFALYIYGVGIASAITLARKYRRAKGRLRQQLKYIFLGTGSTLISVLIFNFILVQFHITELVTLGALSTLFFTGSFAYAIARHRLLDIRAVVARSVAYVLLLTTFVCVYTAAIFGATALLFEDNGIGALQNAVYVAMAVVLAFTFDPLKRFFEKVTDSIFFRDKYDSQQFLREVGQVLVNEFQLERIMHLTLKKIASTLKLVNSQLYVFDNNRIYKVDHVGKLPHKLITAPHLLELKGNFLVADEMEETKTKALMDEFEFRVAVKLKVKGDTVGYMMLGEKLSGDIYTSQDLEVIDILTKELAVAILNAKAYEEISKFNATLQLKVDDATKQLRDANRRLKDLDKAKDEFISMASHQLRTPLTSIKGYLSMLLEGDAGKVTDLQKEFLGYAYGGSQRMGNLITDLLNVSRMSAGKFMINAAPTDIIAVAADEVEQLQQHAQAKNLRLEFAAPKSLPKLMIDEGKTRQVIMNFIDNAIYYTQQGSVKVSLRQSSGSVELRVVDTGIGVPKDAQAKLFTKFYRAGNAQSVRPDGTGLGLFLAKKVVEDQGGRIIFESKEGGGSTFGFSIPIKKETPNALRKPQPVGISS